MAKKRKQQRPKNNGIRPPSESPAPDTAQDTGSGELEVPSNGEVTLVRSEEDDTVDGEADDEKKDDTGIVTAEHPTNGCSDKDEHTEMTQEVEEEEDDPQVPKDSSEEPQEQGEVLETPPQTAETLEDSHDEDAHMPEEQQENHVRSINRLSFSTNGPFTLRGLRLQLPDLGSPTYITHQENTIFVGTSQGTLLLYTRLPDTQDFVLFEQAAFHTTRQSRITKIIPLPTLQVLMVLSGNLLQCFNIVDLKPLSIGRIKDVYDVALDWDNRAKCDEHGVHVVVLTKQQIRIVNVTRQALRLVKDIKTIAQVTGRRGNKLMVANEQYMIIDISKEMNNQNSLLPVNTSGTPGEQNYLIPFIRPVGKDEFLLICGTGKSDPAMGMVVNTKGDVSRGTVSMEKYPDNVIVQDEHTFVLSGNEVNLYSLEDQRLIQSWKFESNIDLCCLDQPIEVPTDSLRDLILLKSINGDDDIRDSKEWEFATKVSQVGSNSVCYCQDFVDIFVPQARLEKITRLRNVRALERELAKSRPSSELTVIEVEYLNLQVSLLRLLTHQYDLALESWTNGTLDPRILLHAFNFTLIGKVYIFQGLHGLFQQLHAMIKETALLTFFEVFLERWLSKESLDDHDTIISIEQTALEYHLRYDTGQLMQILPRLTHIDIAPTLEEEHKYLALAKLYYLGDPQKAVLIHKRLVDGEIVDQGFDKNESLHIICDISKKCSQRFRKEVGLWLLTHDAKLAISFLNSSKISLNKLDTGMSKKEELRHVMDNIDEISLRYEYVAQMFVGLRREKMTLALQKGLHRSLLKRLQNEAKEMKKG